MWRYILIIYGNGMTNLSVNGNVKKYIYYNLRYIFLILSNFFYMSSVNYYDKCKH